MAYNPNLTKAAGNTAAQEAYISSLTTGGALDAGSGFNRSFGAGETNEQYKARLEAWKNRGKTSTTPPTAPRPASAPTASSTTEAPLAGLTAIDVGTGGAQTSQTGAIAGMGGMGGMLEPEPASPTGVLSDSISALRALGRRTPPMDTYALAGLKRIY